MLFGKFNFSFPLGQGGGNTTLTLQPSGASGVDTFLLSSTPDTNNGTVTTLVLRTSRSNLLKFDLTSIPGGATIISATLTLTLTANPANSTVTIYRILPANIAWTELGATWNYALASSTRWAGDTGGNGGADAGCTVSGTDYSATQLGTFNTLSGDTAGTQYVVSLNTTEFGLMLANNIGMVIFGASGSSTSVASSDHATAEWRPKLEVVYSNP